MAYLRKVPEGFIRITRQGAPAYVRPWFKELSELAQHQFKTGQEAGWAMRVRAGEQRHIQTTYLPLEAKVPEMKMAA